MYKVGDRVRVTKLLGMDSFENISVGDVHTITTIRSEGESFGIRIGSNNEYPLVYRQIEKVEEEVKVKKFKMGDKVKVLTEDPCYSGAEKGKVYTVKEVDRSSVHLKEVAHIGGWVPWHDVELVNQTSFTFPEMVQKLIDGEFDVGTELVTTDVDNDENTFYVRKNMYGYGISKETDCFIPTKVTFPSVLNAKWTVKEELPKEEPVKEMSIEELQKELGYKIKITE